MNYNKSEYDKFKILKGGDYREVYGIFLFLIIIKIIIFNFEYELYVL